MHSRGKRRQRGQVLIAIFLGSLLFGSAAAGVLLLTGEPADALRKDIKHLDIADDARRARLLDAVEKWQDANEVQQKAQDQLSDDVVKLMQRHDVQAADFSALFARGDALNVQARDALLELRFALHADLDERQWQTLFAMQQTMSP